MALESPNPDDKDPSTVILRGQDELEYNFTPSDPAGAPIIPGMLLEQTAVGVAPHGTAADEAAEPRFAIENRQQGMFAGPGPANAEDVDAYTPGDTIWEAHFDKGHWVWALLAAGESVNPASGTAENRVVPDGGGGFRVYDPVAAASGGAEDPDTAIMGEAVRDAVDNSVGTDYVRFKMRIY